MSVLEANGLRLVRRGAVLLDGVSLSLRAGEMVGLIGPNGAGKSTLLRLLAGLAPPDAGGVTLLGQRMEDWTARERAARLGYLPQHFAPHWDWRVSEMLRLGLERALRPVPLPSLAAQFGLGMLLGRRWSDLSGGERARVLAAMVLAPDPPVVLADEPEAALDIGQAAALMAQLRARAVAGAAIMVALHELNLAARWCNRLILLVKGRIQLDGTPGEVLEDRTLDEAFGARLERVRMPDGELLVIPTAGLSPG
jgi:iron complex transport system ATP-binding protein